MTDVVAMFDHAPAFNGDISQWDTSAVTSVNAMFHHAKAFDSDLSKWAMVEGGQGLGNLIGSERGHIRPLYV